MRRLGAAVVLALGLAGCAAGQAAPAAQHTPSAAPTWTAPSPTPTHRPRVERRAAITIAFAGDVHFEGAIRQHLLTDPGTTFGAVAPLLRAADLTIVNLETAITERGTPASKQFVFRAPASAFRALRAAGIDVATVANNHGMDYGPVGLQDTLAAARASGFPIIGAGQDEAAAFAPYRVTVKGWKVAVIGATHVLDTSVAAAWTAGSDTPGLASAYRTEQLLDAVRRARAANDTVVVYLHWGTELHECPTASQEELAQQLVAAGADIVVGSHAHVVLGSGHLGKAYVDYGLGNFLFYAHGSGPTTHSSVVTLTVRGRQVTGERRDPVVLSNGWTTPLHGTAAARERARQDALRSCTNVT
jgi:poly-gamma-glutamate capsule biosynthesis protein CapA/YwtB (metallophosphatase superfamily)